MRWFSTDQHLLLPIIISRPSSLIIWKNILELRQLLLLSSLEAVAPNTSSKSLVVNLFPLKLPTCAFSSISSNIQGKSAKTLMKPVSCLLGNFLSSVKKCLRKKEGWLAPRPYFLICFICLCLILRFFNGQARSKFGQGPFRRGRRSCSTGSKLSRQGLRCDFDITFLNRYVLILMVCLYVAGKCLN